MVTPLKLLTSILAEDSSLPKNKVPVKRMARLSGSQFRTPKRPSLTTSSTSPAPSLSSPPSSNAHGEPLVSDYSVRELPGMSRIDDSDSVVLNAGLLARVEYLEAQLRRTKVSTACRSHVRVGVDSLLYWFSIL